MTDLLPSGRLRMLTQAEISAWRKRKIANLHNREGRRVIVEDSFAADWSVEPALLDPAGNPVMEVPEKLKPRTGRETAELVALTMTNHLLHMKKHDPEAYRRRVREIRELDPVAYGHMTDDQMADAILDVCRRVWGEPVTQKVYEKQDRGGGFREQVV